MDLPILKDGDKLEGQACIQPEYLTYCPLCDCVRNNHNWEQWQLAFTYDNGERGRVCPRHVEESEEE